MQAVMIATNEMQSDRFERLCEALGMEGPEDVFRIAGHLQAWRLKWAGDHDLDAGILLDVSTVRMGMWAQWHSPKAFGCALKKAGYVMPVERMYPEELLRDARGRICSGYVAMGFDGAPSLDSSWHGVQRVSSRKGRMWCLFLSSSERRWKACVHFKVSVERLAQEGRVPPRWAEEFEAWCGVRGIDPQKPPPEENMVAPEYAPERAFPYVNRPPERDLYQRDERGSVIPFRNVSSPGRGFAPPQHVRNQGNEVKQGNEGNPRRRGTGAPKSPGLKAVIGDLRNHDLVGALRAIDGGDAARNVWAHCAVEHPQVVFQVLAELLDQWDTVRNPAGWVMNRLIKLYKQDKHRRSDVRSTGLGRGEAPTGRGMQRRRRQAEG